MWGAVLGGALIGFYVGYLRRGYEQFKRECERQEEEAKAEREALERGKKFEAGAMSEAETINEINKLLAGTADSDNKAHQQRTKAGRALLELRKRSEAAGVDWWGFYEQRFISSDRRDLEARGLAVSSRKQAEDAMRVVAAIDEETEKFIKRFEAACGKGNQ
jgi:hypothetical protein